MIEISGLTRINFSFHQFFLKELPFDKSTVKENDWPMAKWKFKGRNMTKSNKWEIQKHYFDNYLTELGGLFSWLIFPYANFCEKNKILKPFSFVM